MFPVSARVAELADARDLKSRGREAMRVRFPPRAPHNIRTLLRYPLLPGGVKKAHCEVHCEVGVLSRPSHGRLHQPHSASARRQMGVPLRHPDGLVLQDFPNGQQISGMVWNACSHPVYNRVRSDGLLLFRRQPRAVGAPQLRGLSDRLPNAMFLGTRDRTDPLLW
jgi:hypothetical protein